MLKKILLSSIFCFLFFLVSANITMAETGGNIESTGTGGNIVSDSSSGSNNTVSLKNPLENAGVTDVPTLIGKIIDALLGVVGSLALIMFIYGGFTWMLAAGNDSQVQKGKNILLWAVIGLVVIFASYSLVHFILKSVAQ
jgi:hypothetical protein